MSTNRSALGGILHVLLTLEFSSSHGALHNYHGKKKAELLYRQLQAL